MTGPLRVKAYIAFCGSFPLIIVRNLAVFPDKTRIAVDTDDTDDEGAPQISLQEMLDDLHLSDDMSAAGGEEEEMMQ